MVGVILIPQLKLDEYRRPQEATPVTPFGNIQIDRSLSQAPSKPTSIGRVVLLGCAAALVLSGCTRTSPFASNDPLPSRQATPLQPAPLTPVRESQLPPPGQPIPDPQAQPIDQPTPIPAEPKPVEVAKVDESKAPPVTRQALIGAWTVTTGGSNCQLFLALTKWSGGFRAAPRGCGSTGIKDVAAWDVKGKQVVLVSSSGSTIATLFKAGSERYNGSVSSGGAISFSR